MNVLNTHPGKDTDAVRGRSAGLSLRFWLAGALLAVMALPPLAVWVLHAASTTTAGPSTGTVLAARRYAAAHVASWTSPAWRVAARRYFAASQVDAELRPAQGPWFSTRSGTPAAGSVKPADKFIVRAPGVPGMILGSGIVVPRMTTRTSWPVPLAGGAGVLVATVAVAWAFLGRTVVRPLAATSRAMTAVPRPEAVMALPHSPVREVASIAAALQAMGADLHAARQRQSDVEEQRRQFIAAIAHDLRTPLFTLRAYLDGLRDGLATTPDKASQYIEVCRASAGTLDHLVADLFTYARMEFLGQKPSFEPVDIAAVVRDAAEAQRPRAAAAGITLTASTSARPVTISADAHLLTRVVANLLDNALGHTPEGGHITLACTATTDEVCLTVTDDGPGIPAGDLPHLFTALYRGEASRSRATGGAGLGLTIAHSIVLAHHGRLTAGNIAPHGAIFTVRIPTSLEAGNCRRRAVDNDETGGQMSVHGD